MRRMDVPVIVLLEQLSQPEVKNREILLSISLESKHGLRAQSVGTHPGLAAPENLE